MPANTITISSKEYKLLKYKSKVFDHFIETEQLSKDEIDKIRIALKGPFVSEEEFIKRHPEIAQ